MKPPLIAVQSHPQEVPLPLLSGGKSVRLPYSSPSNTSPRRPSQPRFLTNAYPVQETGSRRLEFNHQEWYGSQNLTSPEILFESACLRAIYRLAVQPSNGIEASSQALIPPMRPNSLVFEEAPALHVLIVDDNPIIQKLLHRYLVKGRSNIVVTASNGFEAVAAVRDAQVTRNFDLIFMDISMPGMDGFEATRLIRGIGDDLSSRSARTHGESVHGAGERPVGRTGKEPRGGRVNELYIVALTGLASEEDWERADKSGFNEFWTKPITFSKIGDLLMRWNTANITSL